jgi:hypothetical protein
MLPSLTQQATIMKRIPSIVLAISALVLFTIVAGDDALAQAQGKPADKGGAGQYGPIDVDGDGIPNGLDPDFVKPNDGSGRQLGKLSHGKGYGYGDGSGTCGIGPRNGSGLKARSGSCTGAGPGSCDGTGPKGKGGRR